ncbi:MAG: N-acetylmuramoyl-L-alanine amidase [Bacteroidaceae bacterium]|nr:N-acetylmuramoyl-L-alanine amidase [Bacteroidaceae bacterium]
MRTITLIIIHCSATREGKRYTAEDCKLDHIGHKHCTDIGYHFYIEKDGKKVEGRPIEQVGAHCLHHNSHSIGICLEGGYNKDGEPADTRTGAQMITLMELLSELKEQYPHALIVGHYELNPEKPCPCFDVSEYRQLFP